MGALFALIPTKDWLYAGLAVLLLAFGMHVRDNLLAEGAAHEALAVQAATIKAQAAAKIQNDKLTADYAAAIASLGATYAQAIQSADAAHAADLQRLQHRTGNGSPVVSVGGAAGTGPSAASGPGGAVALGNVPAERALDLADALRDDDAALVKCYAERDSLTGK